MSDARAGYRQDNEGLVEAIPVEKLHELINQTQSIRASDGFTRWAKQLFTTER